jgi:1-pyrroline-4-hydroxy-2-carboxylate deaminase
VRFDGVYVAIVTPFTADFEVDYEGLGRHADWLIGQGVHGLVPTGTCGEYAQLSAEERTRVVETVAEAAAGRVPLVVGVAAPTTAQAVHWARHAHSVGAQAVMALPPINYRPTWPEVLAYYQAIGQVGLPIVVYNNPYDTGTDLTAERLHELEAIAPVVAVKEFSQDVRRLSEIRERSAIALIAGADDLVLESMQAGATGWIAGMANIVPGPSVELYDLATAGRLEEAWRLYRTLLPLLRYDTGPRLVQAIKYGMRVVGRPVGDPRPPRLPLEAADRLPIDRVLAAFATR